MSRLFRVATGSFACLFVCVIDVGLFVWCGSYLDNLGGLFDFFLAGFLFFFVRVVVIFVSLGCLGLAQ